MYVKFYELLFIVLNIYWDDIFFFWMKYINVIMLFSLIVMIVFVDNKFII